MSNARPQSTISGTAITSITLGASGLLLVIVFIPGLKLLGLLLGIAALLVGAFGFVNARRSGGAVIWPAVGASLGLVAVIAFLIWRFTV